MTVDDEPDPAADDDGAALRKALARAISATWRGSASLERDRADPDTIRLATSRARRLLILAGRARRTAETDDDAELLQATGMTRNLASAHIVLATPQTASGRTSPLPSRTVIGNQLRLLAIDRFCADEGYELELGDVPFLPGFDGDDDASDDPATSELLAILATGRLGAYRVAAQPVNDVVERELRAFVPYLRSCIEAYHAWAVFFADGEAFEELDRDRMRMQAGQLVVYAQQQALARLESGAPVEAVLATVVLGLTAENLFLASTATDADDLRALPLLTAEELDYELLASGVGAWLDEYETPADATSGAA